MEKKADALLLKSVDYGENDKIVTLLTAEYGKIGAGMKGVKRAGAKLKFAAQPFCFAEYVLAERGGRYTVTGASLYDGFYALREDLNAYYAACAVSETCDKLLYEGMAGGEALVLAVSALKEMSGGSVSGTERALVVFLLQMLARAGYPVTADSCPVCGRAPKGRMRFQMSAGCFVCGGCAEGVPASEITYLTVKRALAGERELPEEGTKRALRLLNAYFIHQTETPIRALSDYLALP